MADHEATFAESNIHRLLDDVQKGGQVWIQTVNQADGPYCTVSGLGVHAGGYRTVDDAIASWLDARDFDALQAKLDNEKE